MIMCAIVCNRGELYSWFQLFAQSDDFFGSGLIFGKSTEDVVLPLFDQHCSIVATATTTYIRMQRFLYTFFLSKTTEECTLHEQLLQALV